MTVESNLPEGFRALEPFVARWAIDKSADRAAMRGDAPEGERKAFYAAMVGQIEPALDYLDTKPIAALDGPDSRLMALALSFAHVALAEEMHRDGEPAHARMRPFMRITRAPADA
jgi:hypothetical protein